MQSACGHAEDLDMAVQTNLMARLFVMKENMAPAATPERGLEIRAKVSA
jgi:hypothetical protein